MFHTVLVANRGEIAVRVIRTLRALGIRSVAVYSDADADAAHVAAADTAVRIGPAAATHSYLDIEKVVAAAVRTGAQAVHPGYGFLSENAGFAAACAEAGLVFVGPPTAAIEAMGDKIRAKQTVAAAGVPVVPGSHHPGMSDAQLTAAVAETGYPVLLKPSAGGGGKGMRLVRSAERLATEIAGARREAANAFGDDTLLVERYVENPRHIEIQVLADAHGNVLHLGERECSLQRRHQKIIEEAPSPLLDAPTRARMGAAAVEAARSVGYTGAGTVEFIVASDRPAEFFFLEMNTRLQVEHPVTELVTGVDLVEWQLRVAAGQPLALTQDQISLTGHAVEARVYAEDPDRDFLPTGGTVLRLVEPVGAHLRVDSGLRTGSQVSSDYDPMLAKVIAWGGDRAEALGRLDAALAATDVLGVTTNTAFLRRLVTHPEVVAGRLDTGLVARLAPELAGPAEVPAEVLAAAALLGLLEGPDAASAFDRLGGWRLGGVPAWSTQVLLGPGGERYEIAVSGGARAAQVRVGDGQPVRARLELVEDSAGTSSGLARLGYDGRDLRISFARSDAGHWLGLAGASWLLRPVDPLDTTGAGAGLGEGELRAPMPGTVTSVSVVEGEKVTAGQPLVTLEAMKMEHTLAAPFDGVVTLVRAEAARTVALDEVLVRVETDQPADERPGR